MRSEPYSQNRILNYVLARNGYSSRGYSTREVANALNMTTGAVLAAFKRLRTSGKMFQYDKKWWVSSSETDRYMKEQGLVS